MYDIFNQNLLTTLSMQNARNRMVILWQKVTLNTDFCFIFLEISILQISMMDHDCQLSSCQSKIIELICDPPTSSPLYNTTITIAPTVVIAITFCPYWVTLAQEGGLSSLLFEDGFNGQIKNLKLLADLPRHLLSTFVQCVVKKILNFFSFHIILNKHSFLFQNCIENGTVTLQK